jgi:hypothetical protein
MSQVTTQARACNYRLLTYSIQKHIELLIRFAEREYGERLIVSVRHTEARATYHKGIGTPKGKRFSKPQSHLISFGSKALKMFWEKGYKEYKSLQWMMRGLLPIETHAIYYIVTHEFAHAVQTQWGSRTYGSVHNQSFVNAYQKLLDEMPFAGEIEKLYEQAISGLQPAQPVVVTAQPATPAQPVMKVLPPVAPQPKRVLPPLAPRYTRPTQTKLFDLMAGD